MKKISVVVPIYNEEGNIQELYDRLKKVFCNDLKAFDYEFIFVDDGSSDTSFALLESIANEDSSVFIIKFTRNFGQHPAIYAGLAKGTGDYVVLMDADLQNPPEEISKLVYKISEGFDIVHGVRLKRNDNFIRRFGSKFYHYLLGLLIGFKIPDMATSLRIISKKVVENFLEIKEYSTYPEILMVWMGFKTSFVNVSHEARINGKSKYSYWKLIKMTVELSLGFSSRILRAISLVGIFVAGFSFLLGMYYLCVQLFFYKMFPGFASLVVLITFFFGLIFIFLGVLGEYLAKVFKFTQGWPYYVVESIINGKK